MVHYHGIINSHSVIITIELFAIQIDASCLKTAKKSFGIQLAVCVISRLDQQTKETGSNYASKCILVKTIMSHRLEYVAIYKNIVKDVL